MGSFISWALLFVNDFDTRKKKGQMIKISRYKTWIKIDNISGGMGFTMKSIYCVSLFVNFTMQFGQEIVENLNP